MINKPMSMLKQEFLDKVIDCINNSQLPLFVVEYVLQQDVLSLVKSASQQQCMNEKAQYEKLLKDDEEAQVK